MTRKHAFFRNHDSFYQFPASIFFPYLNLHDGTTIFKGEFIPSNFKGAKPVPNPFQSSFQEFRSNLSSKNILKPECTCQTKHIVRPKTLKVIQEIREALYERT